MRFTVNKQIIQIFILGGGLLREVCSHENGSTPEAIKNIKLHGIIIEVSENKQHHEKR